MDYKHWQMACSLEAKLRQLPSELPCSIFFPWKRKQKAAKPTGSIVFSPLASEQVLPLHYQSAFDITPSSCKVAVARPASLFFPPCDQDFIWFIAVVWLRPRLHGNATATLMFFFLAYSKNVTPTRWEVKTPRCAKKVWCVYRTEKCRCSQKLS